MSYKGQTKAEYLARRARREKLCGGCGEVKSFDDFYPAKRKADGRDARCIACRRAKKVKPEVNRKRKLKRLGLSEERLLAMLEAQEHRCAVCRAPIQLGILHIDHDHDCCPGDLWCGECIRGLLCPLCNRGLGHFRDNPAVLRAAADYIEVHRLARKAAL